MQLALLIIIMYVLSVFVIALAIAQPNMNRRALFVLGLLSPVIVVISATRAMLSTSPVPPCPVHLEKVEREVDMKRIAIFGGEPRKRYIAHSWQSRYHAYLNRSAKYLVEHIEPSAAKA